jgi:hypothetical protein
MLQIIAFGVGFLLFGVGVLAHDLRVVATPVEKRTASTGTVERIIFIILGALIVVLASGLSLNF